MNVKGSQKKKKIREAGDYLTKTTFVSDIDFKLLHRMLTLGT
jgi:hypothetical protein